MSIFAKPFHKNLTMFAGGAPGNCTCVIGLTINRVENTAAGAEVHRHNYSTCNVSTHKYPHAERKAVGAAVSHVRSRIWY